MQTVKLAILALSLLMLNAIGAFGGVSGNELLQYCSIVSRAQMPLQEIYNVGACDGFLQGIDYAMSNCSTNVDGFSAQLPENATLPQIKSVVLKFFNNNPELLHNEGGQLVAQAVSKAFPCR